MDTSKIRRRGRERKNRVGVTPGLIFGYEKPGFKTKKNQRGRVGLGAGRGSDNFRPAPTLPAGVWRINRLRLRSEQAGRLRGGFKQDSQTGRGSQKLGNPAIVVEIYLKAGSPTASDQLRRREKNRVDASPGLIFGYGKSRFQNKEKPKRPKIGLPGLNLVLMNP